MDCMDSMWTGDAQQKHLQSLERLVPQVGSVTTGMRWFPPGCPSMFTVVVISPEIQNCTLEGAVQFYHFFMPQSYSLLDCLGLSPNR